MDSILQHDHRLAERNDSFQLLWEICRGCLSPSTNQVGEIATSVGMTSASFFAGCLCHGTKHLRVSDYPNRRLDSDFIAVMSYIQMIIDHNNLANFETWIFFKWVFKTFVAVMLIT